MSADLFKWRMTHSNVAADLQRALLIRLGIPTPSQITYIDHTQRISQGDGGIARHGYLNAEILWTKLTPCQANVVRGIVEDSRAANGGNGYVYATIKPLDGSGIEWMDIAGKPDLSDLAPEAPIIGASGYIHSDILLKLNNITIISQNPTF